MALSTRQFEMFWRDLTDERRPQSIDFNDTAAFKRALGIQD